MRAGKYDGWLPTLFVGNLLKGQTVGIIGARRIGTAYARMMVEGFKMNVIYYDLYQSHRLEKFVTAYGEFLKSQGEPAVHWKRASSPEEVLSEADVEAVLVNASRGRVVDEVALVEHLKANPMFCVGLNVFEEPLTVLATLQKLILQWSGISEVKIAEGSFPVLEMGDS